MSRRAELRAALFAMGDGCEWPLCIERATEMAHLHSRGMGGSKHRDVLWNVMRACTRHARISDFQGDRTDQVQQWRLVNHRYGRQQVMAGALLDELADLVAIARDAAGYDVDAMQDELERSGNA